MRRRALLVAPIVPRPAGNGLAIRAALTLDALARDHDVDVLVVPVAGAGDRTWATPRARHVEVLDPPTDPLFGVLAAVPDTAERTRALAAYPRPVMARWSLPATVADAAARFAARPPDLVHVLRSYLAPFAEPWLGRAAFVLDLDEDDALVHRRLGHDDEARKYERLVAEWARRADLVLAAAPLPGATVAPNPVPPRVPGGAVAPLDVLFVGNLSYAPNVDAAAWLVGEVLPRVSGQVRTALVGASPGPDVRALARDSVLVVADPATVAPWYDASRVAVVPLRAGGGTRLKLVEALASGVPVVTTTIGAEGVPVVDGRDVLVADDAGAFADAIGRVLGDSRLAAGLAARGPRVAEPFRWDALVARLAAVVGDLAIPSRS